MNPTVQPKRGMTLKQFARAEFWNALKDYKQARQTGQGLVRAALRLHVSLSHVPRPFGRYARAAEREEVSHV